MAASIASYECTVDGWSWVYELSPDTLIAEGHRGEEHQTYHVELRHCHEVPDRGVKVAVTRSPVGLLVFTAVALALTGLFFASLFLMVPHAGNNIPGGFPPDGLLPLALMVLFLEWLTFAQALPWLFQRRQRQSYITFKRASDGAALLTLHCAPNEPTDSFEDFAEQVLTAIRRQRSADPPPAHAISRRPQ
jgi:hypothetical protein